MKKKNDRNKKIERFLSREAAGDALPRRRSRRRRRGLSGAARRYLPLAKVFYAVKANPAGEVVDLLRGLGSSFDVASRGEIELCIGRGVAPERLSFGNTIKKERDIAYAYQQGVRLFAFDSAAELEKIARSAPRARVFCRILVDSVGAEWPLSRKFGCAPEMAVELLRQAPSSRGSTPTACRSMSARSRPISTSGTAPSAVPHACSRCWPRPTSICAWSISAAASPRIIAATCPASSAMPRR